MALFVANEGKDDSFTLTASQPWHLDTQNYIILNQPTTVQAFTGAQFGGLTFWALDQTNAQNFLNGQGF